MALTKTHEVKKEFFDQFLNAAVPKPFADSLISEAPFLVLTNLEGKSFDTLIRYFNMGGKDGFQDTATYYPVISIKDFPPKVDKQRAIFSLREYLSGFDQETGLVNVRTFPAALNFKFEVYLCTNEQAEFDILCDWFFQNFKLDAPDRAFIFQKTETVDYGPIGIVVPYTCEQTDISRTDGRFEMLYEFTLKPFVHIYAEKSEEFVQEIGLSISISDGKISDKLETVILNYAEKGYTT